MVPRSISESIAGSCVFLTGVTGFVGGCLLERICKLDPGPARIFVLVRKKCDVDPQSRLQKLFSSPLFSGVPLHKLARVQVMSGDVGSGDADLGMNEADVEMLIDSCTHVYHVAAFISFAAQLNRSIKINLRGSRSVLKLAKRMRRLKAMVHVSTAYVNCTVGNEYAEFKERILPVEVDPVEVLNSVNSMSPKDIESKYAHLVGKHPNTYTFTKQLTEDLLARERGDVPLSIVRPGIILNSWREPFAGWVDSVNSGACGFIAGAGKGIFCTFQARANMIMDVIPVDLVVSTILAAALKAELEPKQLHVFHCTSGSVNPTTWRQYCDGVIKASREHPCKDVAYYPRARLRESRLRNSLVILIFQVVPAFFIDLFAELTKPGYKVIEIQRRYAKGNKYTSYFSMREWQFVRESTDQLIEMLAKEERDQHPMDPRQIDWDVYFKDCVVGTRSYFHKEPKETTEKAMQKMAMLRLIAALVPVLSFTGICCFLTLLMGIPWTLTLPFAAFLVLALIWL